MDLVLIDPEGNELSHGWRLVELRELSGLPDASLFDYLCRTMGYAIVRADARCMTLRFNPAILSAPAQATLFYRIADARQPFFNVEVVGSSFVPPSVFSDRASTLDFVARIIGLLAKSGSDRFFRKRTAIGSTEAQTDFKGLIAVLERSRDQEENDFVKAYLRHHFAGRYVVFRFDRGAGRLFIDDAGNGYTGLTTHWACDAIGKPVDQLYDQDYWAFVSEAFEATADAGHPTLDEVDALVQTASGVSTALSYRRLIVPLAGSRLLGVSVRLRDPITLRR